jgi:hypothetical protein
MVIAAGFENTVEGMSGAEVAPETFLSSALRTCPSEANGLNARAKTMRNLTAKEANDERESREVNRSFFIF